MIIGKSFEQRYDEKQGRLQRLKDNDQWFAWRPVQENNGRWVWLQTLRVDRHIADFDGELEQLTVSVTYHLT